MTPSEPRPQEKSVKGSVLVDYLKIIRANPDLPWADHLLAEDLEQINRMILPSSWYPAGMFQRMGEAIFKLVSRENYQVVHQFGRSMADRLHKDNPGMVVKNQVPDTVRKYLTVQRRFYSFEIFSIKESGPGAMKVGVNNDPDTSGTGLLAAATCGTLERLIELAGATDVKIKLENIDRQEADFVEIEANWKEG